MKPICAARQTQAAIAAFLHLLQEGIAPEDIEQVEVAVPPNFVGLISHAGPGPAWGASRAWGIYSALPRIGGTPSRTSPARR